MSAVRQRPGARRDLVEIIAYLSGSGGATARRFRLEAEATFERLASIPNAGTPYQSDDPAYDGLRYALVSKFRRYVVFYKPLADGIEVIRVLHGARDIATILAADLGAAEDEADGDAGL